MAKKLHYSLQNILSSNEIILGFDKHFIREPEGKKHRLNADYKLKLFCTVVQSKSFSRASEIINLTQPAVTQQIQALEAMYDTKLFVRYGSMIALTRAGELLYKYAKEINSLYMAAEKDLSEFTGQVRGVLTIGACYTVGNYLLPALIAKFRKRFPMVIIHLTIGNSKRVISYLHESSVDIAFAGEKTNKKNLAAKKIISDELVLIMQPLHKWSGRTAVSIKELTKEPLIFREKGSGTMQRIEDCFSMNGIPLHDANIACIMGDTESVKGAVEEGLGLAIVSKSSVKKECSQGRLKAVTLKEDGFARDFYFMYRSDNGISYPLQKFVAFLKKTLHN